MCQTLFRNNSNVCVNISHRHVPVNTINTVANSVLYSFIPWPAGTFWGIYFQQNLGIIILQTIVHFAVTGWFERAFRLLKIFPWKFPLMSVFIIFPILSLVLGASKFYSLSITNYEKKQRTFNYQNNMYFSQLAK